MFSSFFCTCAKIHRNRLGFCALGLFDIVSLFGWFIWLMYVMEFPNSNWHGCRFSSTLNEGCTIHQIELLIFDFHLTLDWSFLNFKYKKFGSLTNPNFKFRIRWEQKDRSGVGVKCSGIRLWTKIITAQWSKLYLRCQNLIWNPKDSSAKKECFFQQENGNNPLKMPPSFAFIHFYP